MRRVGTRPLVPGRTRRSECEFVHASRHVFATPLPHGWGRCPEFFNGYHTTLELSSLRSSAEVPPEPVSELSAHVIAPARRAAVLKLICRRARVSPWLPDHRNQDARIAWRGKAGNPRICAIGIRDPRNLLRRMPVRPSEAVRGTVQGRGGVRGVPRKAGRGRCSTEEKVLWPLPRFPPSAKLTLGRTDPPGRGSGGERE